MSHQLIKYGEQDITDSDIQQVIDVLRSEYLTQGPAVEGFENTLCGYCKVNHASATTNATSALHLAYKALGLSRGDILWTSPNTFVATANAALYCDANVDFVDIDSQTRNMSVEHLNDKLLLADKLKQLPKIITAVHFGGQPCQMRDIRYLAQKYDIKVVEDASHAIGSTYDGRPTGNCEFSDASVFSFHPVKIITTGEGGAITTNNADTDRLIKQLRSHGITRNEAEYVSHKHPKNCYYEQIALGFNYRMTDIQAALGTSQLSRVDKYVDRRNELAEQYSRLLDIPQIKIQLTSPNCLSAYHLFTIELTEPHHIHRKDEIISELIRSDILPNVHYIPVHLQPYYQQKGFKVGMYPNAEKYWRGALTLPLHPNLSNHDISRITQTLLQTLNR
jgi:UDP-4-amino-4,6-dideoxy-N-acetyl-beta-L-altrosamine transaminase